jgi:hypothetical protein
MGVSRVVDMPLTIPLGIGRLSMHDQTSHHDIRWNVSIASGFGRHFCLFSRGGAVICRFFRAMLVCMQTVFKLPQSSFNAPGVVNLLLST